jgi:hypothetical protein
MAIFRALRSVPFLFQVFVERARQERKWGPQKHAHFPKRGPTPEWYMDAAKEDCEADFKVGDQNWAVIFNEEAMEALSATTVENLSAERIQAAAVLAAWAEHKDLPWQNK